MLYSAPLDDPSPSPTCSLLDGHKGFSLTMPPAHGVAGSLGNCLADVSRALEAGLLCSRWAAGAGRQRERQDAECVPISPSRLLPDLSVRGSQRVSSFPLDFLFTPCLHSPHFWVLPEESFFWAKPNNYRVSSFLTARCPRHPSLSRSWGPVSRTLQFQHPILLLSKCVPHCTLK